MEAARSAFARCKSYDIEGKTKCKAAISDIMEEKLRLEGAMAIARHRLMAALAECKPLREGETGYNTHTIGGRLGENGYNTHTIGMLGETAFDDHTLRRAHLRQHCRHIRRAWIRLLQQELRSLLHTWARKSNAGVFGETLKMFLDTGDHGWTAGDGVGDVAVTGGRACHFARVLNEVSRARNSEKETLAYALTVTKSASALKETVDRLKEEAKEATKATKVCGIVHAGGARFVKSIIRLHEYRAANGIICSWMSNRHEYMLTGCELHHDMLQREAEKEALYISEKLEGEVIKTVSLQQHNTELLREVINANKARDEATKQALEDSKALSKMQKYVDKLEQKLQIEPEPPPSIGGVIVPKLSQTLRMMKGAELRKKTHKEGIE